MQGHINYTILHAALLLTVTLAAFFEPVDFDSASRREAFMSLMGMSSICYLFTILLCTVYVTALLRPWKQTDVMIIRMNHTDTFVAATVLDYGGTICLLAGTIIVGFEFNNTVGYVMLTGAILALYLIIQWIYTSQIIDSTQLRNMAIFRQHYLDDNGMLRPEHLCKVDQTLHFPPSPKPPSCDAAVKELLSKVQLTQYEHKFIEHEITGEQLPLLDHDLLGAMGIDKVGHRLSILGAITSK